MGSVVDPEIYGAPSHELPCVPVTWARASGDPAPQIDDLSHLARENQWDPADLDWERPVDPGNPGFVLGDFGCALRASLVRLSPWQREGVYAHLSAQMLSRALHVEQGALLASSIIVLGASDVHAKRFAASQSFDEARHVDVFERYLAKAGSGSISTKSDCKTPHMAMQQPLQRLLDKALSTHSLVEILAGMNLVVEGTAYNAMRNLNRQTCDPLLKSITFHVARDEARHFAFGRHYLAPLVTAMHADDREELAQFVFEIISLLQEASKVTELGYLEQALMAQGIEARDVMELQARHLLSRSPVNILAPEHLMVPSLIRSGLITPRTQLLLQDIGIRVSADIRVREALL